MPSQFDEVRCSVCGFDWTSIEPKERLIGISFVVTSDAESDLRGQYGDFVIGKTYNVCFPCWYRALGIKP
jgi:hypothetical protein